jgi:type 1 glutamine amidotransferase
VQAEVEAGVPQVVAWAYERPGGGRGFGFTGGHFHNNWMQDDCRKLVLNALYWTAGGEIPDDGIASRTPTEAEMEENQDYPKPEHLKKRE